MPPSAAVEDYLKCIFHLVNENGARVSTTAVAQRLGVAPPSVSAMLKRLEAEDLLRRTGTGVVLTSEGERMAVRVVRRHRLIETFLHLSLGMPWHEVHAEAEVLEHAVSERLEACIDRALGHPTRDPHGDPIPPADLHDHVEAWPAPLTAAPVGTRFRVERISDRNPEALRYLEDLGIGPGVDVVVEERSPFDGPLWVSVGDTRHAVGTTLAGLVHGTSLGPPG